MEELLDLVSTEEELNWQHQLTLWCEVLSVHHTLIHRLHRPVLTMLQKVEMSMMQGYTQAMLPMLDMLSQQTPLDISARALAAISQLLLSLAAGQGGLRLGPARNSNWKLAFELLHEDRIVEGLQAMAAERNRWMDSPEKLLRAVRHYDAAVQVFIAKSVATAFSDGSTIHERCREPEEVGLWRQVECGARIDIAGGWCAIAHTRYGICD